MSSALPNSAIPLFLVRRNRDGRSCHAFGTDAIRQWIDTAASEYTYTTTETGYAVPHRLIMFRSSSALEGDFPGGFADVVYDFQLRDGKIASLVID